MGRKAPFCNLFPFILITSLIIQKRFKSMKNADSIDIFERFLAEIALRIIWLLSGYKLVTNSFKKLCSQKIWLLLYYAIENDKKHIYRKNKKKMFFWLQHIWKVFADMKKRTKIKVLFLTCIFILALIAVLYSWISPNVSFNLAIFITVIVSQFVSLTLALIFCKVIAINDDTY